MTQFTFRDDNRKVQRKHVNDLIESIKAHGYLNHAPIVLNEDGEIIDGQHRYIACCELGITPPTITIRKDDPTLMVDLNRSQKAWAIEDFINFFAEAGKYSFKILQDFCKYCHLAVTPSLIILLNNEFKSFDDIRTGSLMINLSEQELQEKRRIANDITAIAKLINLKKGNKSITQAYMSLIEMDGFKRDYFFMKMRRYRDRLSLCGTSKAYLQMFVAVYNYRNKGGELVL